MPSSNDSSRTHISYYASWTAYGPYNFSLLDVAVEHLTHIYYAFTKIENGVIVYGDKWAAVEMPIPIPGSSSSDSSLCGQIALLTDRARSPLFARNPRLRTLVSLGGWTWSGNFSSAVRTADSRARLTASIIDFLARHAFDGIDIDWEYPVSGGLDGNEHDPSDHENLGLWLRELRAALGPDRHLTMAVPASPGHIRNLPVAAMNQFCDWINVMTYDAAGLWSETNEHHAALYPMADAAIRGYEAAGLARSKMCLGVPFYGRSFVGIRGSPCTGQRAERGGPLPPPGTSEPGVVDYDDLAVAYGKERGFTVSHDERAACAVHWNSSTGVWVSGESERSVAAKGQYAVREGLRGAFSWNLAQDRHARLLGALARSLCGAVNGA